MTAEFPAGGRRRPMHFAPKPQAGYPTAPTLSRRSLLKLGAGAAALTAAGGYALDRTIGGRILRADAGLATRPVRELTIMGTDGWISMPPGAAPGGPIWPDEAPHAAPFRRHPARVRGGNRHRQTETVVVERPANAVPLVCRRACGLKETL